MSGEQCSTAAARASPPGPFRQVEFSTDAARKGSDRAHICPFEGCGKSYTKPVKLAQHVRSHTGERPFVCDHEGCGASYMRNEHLKAHKRRHQSSEDKPFKCSEAGCGMAFWTMSQLKNHTTACHLDDAASLSTLNGAHDYACTEAGCHHAFHKRKHLRQHIRQEHSDSPFTSSTQLTKTALESDAAHDAENAPLPFPCSHPGCSMRFSTNAKRQAHSKVHQDGRYTCAMEHRLPQTCANGGITADGGHAGEGQPPHVYTFSNWSSLQAHMKEMHPPICPWPGCGKQFSRQDNLRAHYRRHEARKLRLEMENRVAEMGQEAKLNYRRACSSDDSESSSEADADVDFDGMGDGDSRLGFTAPPKDDFFEPTLEHLADRQHSEAKLSQEELMRRATDLARTRPRRGGIFKNLSSPALSISGGMTASEGGLSDSHHGTSASGTAISTSAGPYRCSWNGCSKMFVRKSALSIHVRTAHLGEKPFECQACGKRFAHKHLVSRHRRICTGSRDATPPVLQGSRLRFSNSRTNEDTNVGTIDGASQSDDDKSDEVESSEDNSADGCEMATKESLVLAAPVQEQPDGVRHRLLDLLTGHGYAPSGAAGAKPGLKRIAADEATPDMGTSKRRKTLRDRVFECPWSSIQQCVLSVEASTDKDIDPALRTTESTHQKQQCTAIPSLDDPTHGSEDAESAGNLQPCSYRFKRVYDLRRHLRAHHGLDLEDRELRAWLRFQLQQHPSSEAADAQKDDITDPLSHHSSY
ncbi:hypothetical protein BCV70DRAFT_197158 [Testicularia cyperi]|uniref:C2H2-type domain-containing protein n=1 Tax=Testicularia cyperi TaxID=1882483 RepID=A0A317XXR3_9BASI|nr:hypothetical protein BCV70DRAFT_197158 [Testicularia cyperi]